MNILRYTQRRQGVHAGFTLIEIIVSMAIFTMIGLGVFTLQRSIITNTTVLESSLIAQQQVRKTQQSVVGELRSATLSASGAYPIEIAATSTIAFYANVDTDASIERVRYFFATSTSNGVMNVLKKGIIKPVGTVYNSNNETITTVVENVKNSSSTPIFTYYDSTYDGTPSSTPLSDPVNIAQIRLVKMSLGIDPNAARSPVYNYFVTEVSIRNLKDNY